MVLVKVEKDCLREEIFDEKMSTNWYYTFGKAYDDTNFTPV